MVNKCSKQTRLISFILFGILGGLLVTGCAWLKLGQKQKEEKMIIEVWNFPRPKETEAWQFSTFSTFEKKYPNVKVEFTRLSWARGGQKLDVAVAGSNYPDICGSAMKPSYVLQDVLEPLDDYLTPEERADIFPQPLKVCQFEGKTYAFPWYSTVYITILNTDIFKERGVPLPKDGIWTYEEFVEKMQKLTFDRDGDGKIDVYGIGFGVMPGTGEAWGVMYSDGGRFFNDEMTVCTITSAEFMSGVQKLVDLEHKYKCALPNAGGLEPSGAVWDTFMSEKRPLAATFQGQWALISLKKRNKKIDDRDPEAVRQNWKKLNFSAAITPIGKSGKITTASPGVGNWVVFKQSDPKKRALCIELAKMLALSDEAQWINYNSGTLPVRKSIGNIYGDDPDFAILFKAYENVIMPAFHPEGQKMDNVIQRQIQNALLKEKSVETAMQDAAREVGHILAMYQKERTMTKESHGPKLTPRQMMVVISVGIIVAIILVITVLLLREPEPMKLLRKHFWSYLFIAPSLFVFTIFMLMPVTYSIILAFQKFSVTGSSWVGFANFYKVFTSEVFWKYAIPNTLVYTCIMVPEGIIVALLLASVINPLGPKTRAFFRAAYYLPGVIGAVLIAMIWKWIYDPTFGLFNSVINSFINLISPFPILKNAFDTTTYTVPWLVSICIFVGLLYLFGSMLVRGYIYLLCKGKNPERPSNLNFTPAQKTVLYIASVVSIAIIAGILGIIIQKVIFTPAQVYLSSIREKHQVDWLINPAIALYSIMLSGMLMAPGGGVILFLAAMGRVPKELHESAMIDGAGGIKRWWTITVPLLRPTILYLLVMGTIGSFQVFTNIYIMTGGGPGYATTPLVMLIFQTGFENFEFGLASAQALVLFVMVVTVAVIQFKFLKSDVEY
ncbi:MAG: extracellular solute-binding protein [bacterium]|nr:extracellular solute-binding protein [bacterium]